MDKIAGKVPKLQEKQKQKFSVFQTEVRPTLKRKNKAPQSQRTSIVIGIVFLKKGVYA